MIDPLTAVTAFIALYIAYQQWQTNRRKLDIDLYGRRLRIYQAVDKYITAVIRDLDPKLEDFFEFHRATAEAVFLFPPDISEYIDELSEHSLALRQLQQEHRHARTTQQTPSNYDPAKVAKDESKQAHWFAGQYETARRRFGKYMEVFPKNRVAILGKAL